MRDALQEGFDRLFELTSEQCEEEPAQDTTEETTPTETTEEPTETTETEPPPTETDDPPRPRRPRPCRPTTTAGTPDHRPEAGTAAACIGPEDDG